MVGVVFWAKINRSWVVRRELKALQGKGTNISSLLYTATNVA